MRHPVINTGLFPLLGFREVQLPGYIISALPSAYHGGRALTGDANCMDMNKCKLVAASSESGEDLSKFEFSKLWIAHG